MKMKTTQSAGAAPLAEIRLGDDESQSILFKLLDGIKKDWHFSSSKMAKCLAVPATTYNGWEKKKKLPVRQEKDARTQAILSFLSLYRSLSSIFPSPGDQLLFLNAKEAGSESSETAMSVLETGDIEKIGKLRAKIDYLRGLGV
jgi:hypothetical protein